MPYGSNEAPARHTAASGGAVLRVVESPLSDLRSGKPGLPPATLDRVLGHAMAQAELEGTDCMVRRT